MIDRTFILSRAEAEMALEIVNYVVQHSSIDAKSDAKGIYLEVHNFFKYISAKETPTLIRLLQRYRYFADLDGKVLDAITKE